jgi:hypothetical protein
MVSIDYCILTMEIMEIYHKCSSDNDSQIWQRIFDFSQLYTKNINKKHVQDHRHEEYNRIHLEIIPL